MADSGWVCSRCGYDEGNRARWCNLGCGSDYNQMISVRLPAIRAIESGVLRAVQRAKTRGEV